MKTKSPVTSQKIRRILAQIGAKIQRRRKDLGVSATATAEAAGISRITLNRIENGEPSVNTGSYLNAMEVLGLKLEVVDSKRPVKKSHSRIEKGTLISIADFPELKKLAWQLKENAKITPEEALNLYERNWKMVDLSKMSRQERKLILELMEHLDTERLLV